MSNWKAFHHRNLWQHSLWDSLQRSSGKHTYNLSNAGASALVIKNQLPFGLSWLEVPRGPLFEDKQSLDQLVKQIEEMATRENAVFVRMSSYKEMPLKDKRLKPTIFDKHPGTSLVIDLGQSEEELLAQMKPKGRYNIKVAQKHDIKIERSGDIEEFYHLLRKTGMRDGFGIHGKEYYKNMIQALGQHGELLVAKYEERVVAAGIFVYLDEWGVYYYGASDHNYRKYMAPYLIQWEAIKEAKKRGCKYYDFLGVAPENSINHPWAGVSQFKQKFGGRMVNYPKAKDLVLKPFWYLAYRLRKGKR